MEKCATEEELMLQIKTNAHMLFRVMDKSNSSLPDSKLALEVVRQDTGSVSKLPKHTYLCERHLSSHKEFKFTCLLNKHSAKASSHAPMQSTTTEHRDLQVTTAQQDEPPPSSAAVKKHHRSQPQLHQEQLSLPPPKKEQQQPQPSSQVPVQHAAASPQSELSVSLGNPSPNSFPNASWEEDLYHHQAPIISQHGDAMNADLERFIRTELEGPTPSPSVQELLKAH